MLKVKSVYLKTVNDIITEKIEAVEAVRIKYIKINL